MDHRDLRRRVDDLDTRINAEQEAKAWELHRRYGGSWVNVFQDGTQLEKKFVLEWAWPEVKDKILATTPFIVWTIWEHYIYPAVLDPDLSKEDEDIVRAIDNAFIELAYSDEHADLRKEVAASLNIERGPEGLGDWRISEGLAARLKAARSQMAELKNLVRDRLRREQEEDDRLLALENEDGDTIESSKVDAKIAQ
jgi:hypothetical protein